MHGYLVKFKCLILIIMQYDIWIYYKICIYTPRSVMRAVRTLVTSRIQFSISRGPFAIVTGGVPAGVTGAFSLSRNRICNSDWEDCSPLGSSSRLIPNSDRDSEISVGVFGGRSQGRWGIVTWSGIRNGIIRNMDRRDNDYWFSFIFDQLSWVGHAKIYITRKLC